MAKRKLHRLIPCSSTVADGVQIKPCSRASTHLHRMHRCHCTLTSVTLTGGNRSSRGTRPAVVKTSAVRVPCIPRPPGRVSSRVSLVAVTYLVRLQCPGLRRSGRINKGGLPSCPAILSYWPRSSGTPRRRTAMSTTPSMTTATTFLHQTCQNMNDTVFINDTNNT